MRTVFEKPSEGSGKTRPDEIIGGDRERVGLVSKNKKPSLLIPGIILAFILGIF